MLLQITSLVLSEKSSRRKHQETIGGKLAPAIFQTLIVTWIKANLNVVISTQLWDQFLEVLTSLTQWEELIREWAVSVTNISRILTHACEIMFFFLSFFFNFRIENSGHTDESIGATRVQLGFERFTSGQTQRTEIKEATRSRKSRGIDGKRTATS